MKTGFHINSSLKVFLFHVAGFTFNVLQFSQSFYSLNWKPMREETNVFPTNQIQVFTESWNVQVTRLFFFFSYDWLIDLGSNIFLLFYFFSVEVITLL